jgi:hypothetical protein
LFQIRIAVLEKTIGEEIRTGEPNVFNAQPKVRRICLGEVRFSVAGKNTAIAGRGEKGDGSIASAKVFVDLPCLRALLEGAEKRVALDVYVSRREEDGG